MKRLFQGGRVVSGSGVAALDVLVNGETVEAVGPHLSCPEAETVDVTGKLLFPGFIDAHTHFDLDVCNTTTADDFATGTRAALRGGTTLVIDFACPNKGETLQYGLDLWHKKADGKSSCDYGFHMTIDDWNEGIRSEIPQMREAGIPTFKRYMTYPAMMIGDRDLFLALEELGKYGAFAGVHCENAGVIDALIAQKKAAGEVSPASHPATRPNALEAEAVGSLLRMAQVAGAPVITESLGGLSFEISPLSFYQVNPRQMLKLYDKVLEYASLRGDETVLDLYCGVGSIGLFCAEQMRRQGGSGRVVGIESVRQAVLDANRNAVINGIVNATYICGRAEEELPKLTDLKAEVAILDPPRAGCRPELLKAVAQAAVPRLIYVSCDAATMARDIRELCALGYIFEEATPVDMFPWTGGIEVVAGLTWRG